MNYAEDRLDRKARADAADVTTTDEIASDLEQAHLVFKQLHSSTKNASRRPNPEVDGADDIIDNTVLTQIKDAHELAGRTLRDCGRIRQSVFHFGMAWKLCHHRSNDDYDSNHTENDEWKAVSDYAQICEFAGLPEIGILALLYYRCRGRLDPYIMSVASIIEKDSCGCGIPTCGSSPCFIAFPLESEILNDIMNALEQVDRKASVTAFDILGHHAIINRSKAQMDVIHEMHEFLKNKMTIPHPILQFWNNEMDSSSIYQKLPTVTVLLLVKLLYSSPVGGLPNLACISMAYLSTLLSPSSKEGKRMARDYKSHWAYFVFIRYLVFGERMKKHRMGKFIHHNPTWDFIFCEDAKGRSEPIGQKDSSSPSCYLRMLIRHCSSHEATFGLPQVINQKSQNSPPIWCIGDSHVLSIAWQTLRINATDDDSTSNFILRTATPFVATGLKAYHLRSSTRFFTHYNLHACLERIDTSQKRTIILSAGEIDCREGIGGTLLKGYYRSCNKAVEDTVQNYLSAASEAALRYNTQLLIMPVAPHAYRSDKNGKSLGRSKRRETMALWNQALRTELQPSKWKNVFLLDYEEYLQFSDQNSPVGYVLNSSYNADYTHTNNAIVPLISRAIQDSGCDLTCL